MSLIGYTKIIAYAKFEDFETIRFWVVLRTNRLTYSQTDAVKRFTPATVVSKYINGIKYNAIQRDMKCNKGDKAIEF